MISSAHIKNFKVFEDLEVDKLSPVTLIGGRNNCGKTTFMEALFLLFDRLNPAMLVRQFGWRGVGLLPLRADTMWAPVFHAHRMEEPIEVRITRNGAEEGLEVKFDQAYGGTIASSPSGGDRETRHAPANGAVAVRESLDLTFTRDGDILQRAHLVAGEKGPVLDIDHARGADASATMLPARQKIDPNEDAQRFGILDVAGEQDAILEILQVMEPKLQGLSVVSMGPTSLIHGDTGVGRKLPILFMGDGLARLLSLALAIATNRDGVVFIDEIENGIHHSVMEAVWRAILKASVKFNCQVIATTHSYECLKAAHKACFGPNGELFADRDALLSYVRLARNGGRTAAKVFSHDVLGAALEAEMEVR